MTELQTNWEDIFKNVTNIDINTLDTINFKLLVKYFVVIKMQFQVFEKLFNNDITDIVKYIESVNDDKTGVEDGVGNVRHVTCNENLLLEVASTVKHLHPIHKKIESIIKKNPMSKGEFKELLKNTINEYIEFYNITK